jgi:FkbM family methyltransferase
VGVANGTPWLCDAFPGARFALVEANPAFEPAIRKAYAGVAFELNLFAAGPEAGETDLHVEARSPSSSGLRPPSALLSEFRARHGEVREATAVRVPIRPLDSLLPLQGPILLKLDIEGYEWEALQGAPALLAQTEVVISEVSVADRRTGGYRFEELIAAFAAAGFRLYDIPEMHPLKAGERLAYLDAAFVRGDSALLR